MKGKILIAIITGIFLLGGAVLSSPHWFKFFFPEQYLEQENIKPEVTNKKSDSLSIDKDKKSETTGTQNLIVTRIELTPRKFSLPSYFYFQIVNKGTRTIKDLNITIDFGKSSYTDFDYTKKVKVTANIDSADLSFINLSCPQIKKNESIDFYAFTTEPVFKSILLNASNLTLDKEYTYNEFMNTENVVNSSNVTFTGFLLVLLGLVIIVLSTYFVIVIIIKLNRVFNIQ